MAKKKITLEMLATEMRKGFASSDKKFEALAEDIAGLRTELKGDIAALGERLTSIDAKLRGINRRLDLLEEQVAPPRTAVCSRWR
jgi:hypothetical protein